MFIEADAELEIKVYSNLGKLYVAKIPTTVDCWADKRVEECHGFHSFYDIDDVSYDNAVQEATESFYDLEYAAEFVEDELAEGEKIIDFVAPCIEEWDVGTSAHVLHD